LEFFDWAEQDGDTLLRGEPPVNVAPMEHWGTK